MPSPDAHSLRSLEALLPRIVDLARAAGVCILAHYHRGVAVEHKADDSPVTAADRDAHDCIVAGLAGLTPGVPVWSEESAAIAWTERAGWGDFWLVDPLDGTREFLKHNGEFTVNIALVRDHAPVLGVVHAPALGRDYWGAAGLGAFRRDGGDPPRAIRVAAAPGTPLRIAGSRSHRGASLDGFLASVGPHEFVSLGSSLKFCLVAEGAADVYPRLGPTSEWDTAAAQAVLEAAGGHVVDLEGRALRYNRRPEVLNPDFIACAGEPAAWVRRLRS